MASLPDISIVIPTLNEAENIPVLIKKLECVLADYAWEIIVVDDNSTDGTADVVRQLGETNAAIRCLQRTDRTGLSSACIEGIQLAAAPLAAVIDADLQHDETLLPRMIETLNNPEIDVVVGSRYMEGGDTGDWSVQRVWVSKFATLIGRMIIPKNLTDPMSGFFMIRRQVFLKTVPRLYGQGFKILLDIFASSERKLVFRELPYTFRTRNAGESKLSSTVILDYAEFLIAKTFGKFLPSGFLLFIAVGSIGVAVHLAVLALLHKTFLLSFDLSQALAIWTAMTANFFMNNAFTYRHMALKGKDILNGLLTFYVACAFGAIVNLAVAVFMESGGIHWAISGVSGGVAGAVWNFATTRIFTWKKK